MTAESEALRRQAREELLVVMPSLLVDDREVIAVVLVRWHQQGVLAERARLIARIQSLTQGSKV